MSVWPSETKTALLLAADGTKIYGHGFGATGHTLGEVCFNTAMSGYQEIITDPSYAGQIVAFTFPHIGNVGVNPADTETSNTNKAEAARGIIVRERVSDPSNFRAQDHLSDWLAAQQIIGISGVDTRAITTRIRDHGMFNAVLAHAPDGQFDEAALAAELKDFAGLEGADLAGRVTSAENYAWAQGRWHWPESFSEETARHHVVALDFGIKKNILRCLASVGCRVTVVPATTAASDIMALEPDGIFLSNGPGDPAATGAYAVAQISALVESGLPVFGICLGHQMLALALGAQTQKMRQGHHGANHPVKDVETGKVEITSMNHGFTVDRETLPDTVAETHISLFDGTNCGIRLKDRPVFSVQYHPEASPGPQDSHYLFDRFTAAMEQ